MGLLGSILLLFIVIHMSDFWYKYKFTDSIAFKEYRTDLSSGKTTVADFTPASKDFEHSVSTENNVEIVRVKDIHTKVAASFSQLWYVIMGE